MAMLPYFPVETVVGSHLQAAITMKASNGKAIYQNILGHVGACHFLTNLSCHLQVLIFTDVMHLAPL